jgi:arylsulfatase A-like enzyme
MSDKFLSLFSIGITGLMAASCSQKTEKPNVIIILADDMGYGDVSFNNPQARTRTPNIDSLARNGICFSDTHSGGAVSIPSRYGLLTGRYYFRLPKQNAYFGYLPPLIEEGRETIGSVMQKAGYTTACIGKWHLGLNWQYNDSSSGVEADPKRPGYTNTDFTSDISGGPRSLGFDYSFIIPASLDMPPYVFVRNASVVDSQIVLVTDHYSKSMVNTEYAWDRKHTGDNDIYWGRGVWWRNGEMSRSFKVEECLDIIVNEGVTFIKEQVNNNPQNPFMLYLALTAPHTPWMPGGKFRGSSAMGTYGDFISMVDDVIGQITGTLRALNIYDNTLLIFASDNGAHWSENDIQAYGHQSNWKGRGQKGDIWDGGHHVPMFVVWPSKIKKAFTYSHTVSLVDIMATLAEMTGVKINENYGEDSFSFFKVIDGNHTKPVRESIIYISSANKLAIEKNSWKFIDCLGSGGFTDPSNVKPVTGGPQGQLYNLKADPLETTNLYLNESLKVSQLSGLLDSLVRQGYSRKAGK